MPYRIGTKLPKVTLYVNNNYGGMGDMIARLPAFKYTLERHPHVFMKIFVYDYLVELYKAALSGFGDKVEVHPRSEFTAQEKAIMAARAPIVDFTPYQTSSAKNSLTAYGFMILENRIPAPGPAWDYIQLELTEIDISVYNIPKRFGALCTGYTAPCREWPSKYSYEVAEWMVQQGITPVYLGKATNPHGVATDNTASLKDESLHPGGIDLRNKTTVLEAAKILSQAQFVAGVDNGLLHLASMTQVPTIWGFTTILPHTRLPYRNGKQGDRALYIVPEPTLACRFCQSQQNYVPKMLPQDTKGTGHDYKLCMYDDYLCTKHLTAGKFIDRIKQVIGYVGHGANQTR